MSDLKILVQKAFDRGFIDSHVLGFDHFEEDLRRGIEHPGEPRLPDDRDCTLFGDTVEELSGWYCFTEQYRADQKSGNGRQGLIVSVANVLRIRSKESVGMIHVPAAVGRNSRSAALLRCGLDRSAPRLLCRMSPEPGWCIRGGRSDRSKPFGQTGKASSQRTRRWREMDSNLRFPNRSAPVFETAVPSPMTVSRPGTASSNPSPRSASPMRT